MVSLEIISEQFNLKQEMWNENWWSIYKDIVSAWFKIKEINAKSLSAKDNENF